MINRKPAARWWALRLALFLGLTTGFAEALLIVFRQHVLHKFVWTPSFHLWTAPLIYAVLFSVIGFALAFAARSWQRVNQAAPLILGTVALFILTLQFPQIGRLGGVILALGVATQIAIRINAKREQFDRTSARMTVAMGIAVLLLIAALPLSRRGAELWAKQRLGPARAGAPNIVLIFLDTVRAASLGLYGGPVANTRNLERWVSEGVVFERAIAPSSWTLPSHASMLTGRWVHQLDVNWRKPLGSSELTLAETLKANGYATGAFVANDRYTFRDSGLDQGFIRFDDYQFTKKEVLRSPVLMQTSLFRTLSTAKSLRTVAWAIKEFDLSIPAGRWGQRKNAPTVRRNFVDWAEGVAGRPFFAFLNYYDAHDPYRCPPEVRKQFDCSTQLGAYQASIAYLDIELDRLFQQMKDAGILDNTVVIVTSDHGEQFGEHAMVGHGNSLYMPSVHIPLLIFGKPLRAAATRIAQPVSGRDVPATILDLAGVAVGDDRGSSLVRYWDGGIKASDPAETHVFAQIVSRPFLNKKEAGGDARISIIFENRQYILNERAREQIFQLDADTTGQRNLYGLPAETPLLRRARDIVRPIVVEQGAAAPDIPPQP